MRTLRAGVYLRDERLTVVALSGRRSGPQCFAFEPEEMPGARLKSELDTRQLKVRRMRVGLARGHVTVKALEMPYTRGAQLSDMVAFELERHVPFPPEDIRFDFVARPGKSKGPLRVLVAACERRRVEGALRLLEEAHLKPAALTVACHDLPHLLRRRPLPRRAVWAHRASGATDLVCVDHGRLELSRTVPVKDAEELATEITTTLRLLDERPCEAIWISGDDAPDLLGAPVLAELGISLAEPPLRKGVQGLVKQLPEEDFGAAMLALAVAVGSPRPPLDLLPTDLRPRTVTAGQIVTGGTALLTVLLGLAVLAGQGHKEHRYADQLGRAIRELDPEVRQVENLNAELARRRRLLEAIQSIERSNVRALTVLKELTERLPPEAWLRTLNMDKQGIEITGQAAAANQLIPLLEGSSLFTRVEFTAPVTKAGDKEQFRIKAAWKDGAREPEPAQKTPPPPPPSPRGGATRPSARGGSPLGR
jgi:Tfp pilus assembly protein PilN